MRMLVPFRAIHYEWLADKPRVSFFEDEALRALSPATNFTYVVDGRPVACGGAVQQWPGRSVAWACLGDATGPHMLAITRAAQSILDNLQGRIEATVRADFPPGQRWLKLLGFEVETKCLRAYGPEGEDHISYARHN